MKPILACLLLLGSGLAFAGPAATAAAIQDQIPLVVSPDWLAAHLNDARVRIIATGERDQFAKSHIPGARFIGHEDTMTGDHHLLPPETLATALARAGATDDARIVLYGDSPMATGWLYMALASIGHGDHVSMLDGTIAVWSEKGRPVSTAVPSPGSGRLTAKPAPDVIVAAPWVRDRLNTPNVRVLDVRSNSERAKGYLPGSTLILWRNLFSDPDRGVFKSRDEIRALLTKAGVGPSDQVVTYCAIGMRASLMYFAAKYVGIPARVYVGSFEDWQRQAGFPIVKGS